MEVIELENRCRSILDGRWLHIWIKCQLLHQGSAQRLYDKVSKVCSSKNIELPSSLPYGEPSSLKVPWTSYGPSNIRIVPFPTREYTDDEFQSIIKSVMCVLHLLGFLYPISRLISYSVFEKEQKIRGLYMMGLEDGIFHLSWFIAYDLQLGLRSLGTLLSDQDFPINLLDLTSHVIGEYLRVPVPSTQLSDQDFLSHLIDLNAQVVD
ncbi:unnamed protein product [Prunus armeniaca]|uniref:Uncharacterized protein n=1 Tax=Prunus armeniaca TaxID=36596 RepID=A0A6J5X8C6_PRUAR|nr:unnamed protein product [Prunus armeniaca]CAB4308767.1 unnamed protein product [Prunus armeniaca]